LVFGFGFGFGLAVGFGATAAPVELGSVDRGPFFAWRRIAARPPSAEPDDDDDGDDACVGSSAGSSAGDPSADAGELAMSRAADVSRPSAHPDTAEERTPLNLRRRTPVHPAGGSLRRFVMRTSW
jgi:hypothetical protein